MYYTLYEVVGDRYYSLCTSNSLELLEYKKMDLILKSYEASFYDTPLISVNYIIKGRIYGLIDNTNIIE